VASSRAASAPEPPPVLAALPAGCQTGTGLSNARELQLCTGTAKDSTFVFKRWQGRKHGEKQRYMTIKVKVLLL